MTATATRTATFAGTLGYGDWSAADGVVTIHRQAHELFGPASRSPRPAFFVSLGWGEYAGMSAVDVWEKLTAQIPAHADAEGFLPGHDLEGWCLPAVNFTFDFLVTPTGEWPQGSAQ